MQDHAIGACNDLPHFSTDRLHDPCIVVASESLSRAINQLGVMLHAPHKFRTTACAIRSELTCTTGDIDYGQSLASVNLGGEPQEIRESFLEYLFLDDSVQAASIQPASAGERYSGKCAQGCLIIQRFSGFPCTN